MPHITDAIQSWVERVADIPVSADSDAKPEVCIIELGGTIGDIEGKSTEGIMDIIAPHA